MHSSGCLFLRGRKVFVDKGDVFWDFWCVLSHSLIHSVNKSIGENLIWYRYKWLKNYPGPLSVESCWNWGDTGKYGELDTELLMCLTSTEWRRITSFDLLMMLLLMQPMMLAAFFPARAHYCTCWGWCPPWPPRHFLQSCFLAGQSPAHPGTWMCRTCICLGWSSWDSSLTFSAACGGPSEWQHNQPPGVSVAPPSSVLSVDLLKVHTVSTGKSLMSRWNSTDPISVSWVIALVTDQ